MKKFNYFIISLLGCMLYAAWGEAAETPQQDLNAASSAMQSAEQDFKQAEKDFNSAVQGAASQKTGNLSWSQASGQAQSSTATSVTGADPANPHLHGSPETGYAGTWTDPATGDIITSVIAPTPPASQNSQSWPIIIEPNVGGNWSGTADTWSGGGSYPQWPVTPDNPGYGFGTPPPPPPSAPPYRPGNNFGGQNYYPHPSPPPNFHPGYRPLQPNRPGFNPGAPTPSNPGSLWQPGNNWNNPPGQGNAPWQPGHNWGTGTPGQWQPGNNSWNRPPNAGSGGQWQPGGNWNRPPAQDIMPGQPGIGWTPPANSGTGGQWQPGNNSWQPPYPGAGSQFQPGSNWTPSMGQRNQGMRPVPVRPGNSGMSGPANPPLGRGN